VPAGLDVAKNGVVAVYKVNSYGK